MKHLKFLSVTMAILAAVASQAQQAPWVIGLPELHRLDLMPAFKRSVKIGAFTSYDRTEGNDDGFSGKYSFIRKEGDALVLAEVEGPGCIYRIHTPTPTDDPLEIYFDGESTPRINIPFRQLFTGTVAPFVRPLVDYAGGGYTCYVPLTFKKSCKVVLRAKSLQFYDLNYAVYPKDAPIQSFDMKATAADTTNLSKAKTVFDVHSSTELTAFNVPPGTKLKRQAFDSVLQPGKSLTLFQTNKGGRIAGLRLGPAEAFVGKERDIMLKVSWDGDKKPAVLCPAGDFFGYGWGKPAMGGRLVGTRDGMNYCYLPMPFDKAAKIELISLSGTAKSIRGEIVVGDTPRKPYEGKFYAHWHRENPTTKSKPFTFFESKGRGHIVGLALQSQGMTTGNTVFFEGDDHTTVDGELVVHGTGSEDFFNGGWYDVPDRWDTQFARALSGCMAYQKYLGRTGAYRFFIGDAYSYRKSILQTIEHGPERNETPTDYCSVTYLYSQDRPTVEFKISSKAERTVIDPKDIVYSPDWAVPISSFSFREATLSRKDVPADGKTARCLSFRAQHQDFFGPPFLSLVCDLPASGKYKVYMDAVKGPEQGMVQLFRDEAPMGDVTDLFAEQPTVVRGVYLGEFYASEGANRMMFKLVGKDQRSKFYGFDLASLRCVRVP